MRVSTQELNTGGLYCLCCELGKKTANSASTCEAKVLYSVKAETVPMLLLEML